MRNARIRGEGLSYYHCLSRVVDRRFIFGDEEREFLVILMRKLEAFLGLRVVTYVVMSNHFHLLVEEPDREQLPPLDRDTLLRRLGFLYDRFTVEAVREELDRAAGTGNGAWEAQILARYERRMGDVSIFMKELKQRFTQWYNRRKGRKGTLWEERFKSVLVEGEEKALMTVAAYIDLNPVRAGMVERVEDYRWCGYASAVAGNRWAREGLGRILSHSSRVSGDDWEKNWEATAPLYRLWLYDQGEAPAVEDDEGVVRALRKGFSAEEVEAEQVRGGKLPLRQVIRLRVRYFTDGAVLGGAAFVEGVFARHRERFGLKRRTGARPMEEADWEGLCVLRDLKRDRIG
ncbi:MAG: transposase [Verrucomicrobiales bacterium]|nr:transposase [Verrucomicrobiales bacterium]